MTTTVREIMRQEVAEGGSALFTFTLEDENGVAIPLAALQTLRWWHYAEGEGENGAKVKTTINSRTDVDIKNANGGTVHATSGACTLVVTPADNAIIDASLRYEWHVAVLKGTYNGGAGVVEKEVAHRVVNLSLPTP